MCDLTDTDWKIFVGMHSVCINHHMMRAVHWTENKGLSLHFHCREHIVFVMIPMTGCFIQINRTNTRCHNMKISKFSLLCFDIIFKFLPYCVSFWKEHWKSTSNKVIRHEKIHLFTDFSVVTVFCFLKKF